MREEYVQQWGLVLIHRIFEVVYGESKKQGNVDLSKEIFYQMIAPKDKTIQGWKYRCLMYGDKKKASGSIYGYVSEVLKEKVKLDRDYAEFKKPIKLGDMGESEIEKYIECINRSKAVERRTRREWDNDEDKKYADSVQKRIDCLIETEWKGTNNASSVKKIACYFENRKSIEEETADEYLKRINNFLQEYKKNKYMLQYMGKKGLEDCAHKLLEMSQDMMAVKKYKEIVQTGVQKKG